MRVLTLLRLVKGLPDGVPGVWLFDDGNPYFTSIELPWKNNQNNISHVPIGEYIADRVMSPKRGFEVYVLRDVLNRDFIEIHPANTMYDLLGCIGVGSRFGVVDTIANGPVHGILESKSAFNQFMAMLKNDPQFKLVIKEI